MKNCLIYIRTAVGNRDNEKNNLDVEIIKQITRCKEYAHRQKYKVLDIFSDIGISGNSIKQKGLFELRAYCQKSPPEAVIVIGIDKLARNISTLFQIRKEFAEKGIKILSVNEGDLSDNSPTGMVITAIAMWESEFKNSL